MTNINIKFKRSEVNYTLIELMIKGVIESSKADNFELNLSYIEPSQHVTLKDTDSDSVKQKYKQGDIIEVDFGDNKFSETSGVKLAIVVQNDIGNRFSPTLIVLPIEDNVVAKMSYDTLTEYGIVRPTKITTIDKKRVVSKVGIGKSILNTIFCKVLDNLHEKQIAEGLVVEDMYKRGSIVFVDLGKGVGSEQGGKRPCIILQNTALNKKEDSIVLAPLSTKKASLPTHYELDETYTKDEFSTILFEQIKAVDKTRIIKFLNNIDFDTVVGFDKLKTATMQC